ncbi:MAG: hypothetical protein KAJ51_06075, partial [Thermoplasmata archaeon]|nr:hypothetical protein [Thermoplasmata archaeon]
RKKEKKKRAIPIIAVTIVAIIIIAGIFLFIPAEDSENNDIKIGGTIYEGKGLDSLQIGDSQQEVIDKLGQPNSRSDQSYTIWLNYRENYGIDLLINRNTDLVTEIRFNEGFDGGLSSGITIGTHITEVLNQYNGPTRTLRASSDDTHSCVYGSHKILYMVEDEDNNIVSFKYVDAGSGILFWFGADEMVIQVDVFSPFEETIYEGIGLSYIQIGDDINKMFSAFGTEYFRNDTANAIWISYRETLGIDFLVGNVSKEILEIRFNYGFNASLPNGIKIGSTLNELINQSYSNLDPISIDISEIKNIPAGIEPALYEVYENNNIVFYELFDLEAGILYWTDDNGIIIQIVVAEPLTIE